MQTLSSQRTGLVIARYNRNYAIEDTDGRIFQCVARKKLPPVVCGDLIEWDPADLESGVIHTLHRRKSLLSRPDTKGVLKPVAANVDQIIVVINIDSPYSIEDKYTNDMDLNSIVQVDRYLVAAETIGAKPMLVINKADQIGTAGLSLSRLTKKRYKNINYETIYTSTKSGQGIPELRQHLSNRTSIFVGQSGVGKSSLIDKIIPDLDIRIDCLSAISNQGRHTTTTTTLYHLPDGGHLIDSPGVREFGLWNMAQEKIAEGFIEFRNYQGMCKFRDCKHTGEPGCAIETAVSTGKIEKIRLTSYREIIKSVSNQK
ncbi:MAG: small ribosomal subunit biogenesis GTPase RsgA [Gammaproteobacteria bacterium]